MTESISERLADALRSIPSPPAMRELVERLLIDVAGLCVAARSTDYVRAALDGWEAIGGCTAIGHARALDAAGAAFVNGTAAHGEDFDDTFEGGPVHAGAVDRARGARARRARETPRARRAARHRGRLRAHVPREPGRAAGASTRRASIRPRCSARWAAAAGASAPRCGLSSDAVRRRAGHRGFAWRAASSSTSPKAPGPSACIRAGRRSRESARRDLARARLRRPAHGVRRHARLLSTASRAPPTATGRSSSTASASAGWRSRIAFKPYACGTMTQPYVDCARRLATQGERRGHRRNRVRGRRGHGASPVGAARRQAAPAERLRREVQPALLHRRRLRRSATPASRRSPRSACATRACSRSPRKVRYEIDPDNPYPDEFTGHVRVRLKDGSVLEERQPHLRGGAHEPLSRADLEEKFRAQLRVRRLAGGARRRLPRLCAQRLRAAGRPVGVPTMTTPSSKAASPSSPAPRATSAAPSRSSLPTPAPRWS